MALVVHVQLFFDYFCAIWVPASSACDETWFAIFLMEVVMFLCSVLYSDNLQLDFRIQDEFTTLTSPCII
jgi:hypothetical protein